MSEAATYTSSFILSHASLYGSRVIDDLGTGLGKQYHMSTGVRQLPLDETLFFQVSSVEAGHLYADGNDTEVLVSFTVDFWVKLKSGGLDSESRWTTKFNRPLGQGLFFKGVDQLIDPWWWQDPALGNPSEYVQSVVEAPRLTVEPERIGLIMHAQVSTLLSVVHD